MLGFRELPYGVTDVLSSAGYFTIIVARLLENGLQFHIDFNFRSNLGMSRGYPLKSIADRVLALRSKGFGEAYGKGDSGGILIGVMEGTEWLRVLWLNVIEIFRPFSNWGINPLMLIINTNFHIKIHWRSHSTAILFISVLEYCENCTLLNGQADVILGNITASTKIQIL